MELLDHIWIPFLIFWGIALLFSIVVIPVYISTKAHKTSNFSTSSPTLISLLFFNSSRASRYEMGSVASWWRKYQSHVGLLCHRAFIIPLSAKCQWHVPSSLGQQKTLPGVGWEPLALLTSLPHLIPCSPMPTTPVTLAFFLFLRYASLRLTTGPLHLLSLLPRILLSILIWQISSTDGLNQQHCSSVTGSQGPCGTKAACEPMDAHRPNSTQSGSQNCQQRGPLCLITLIHVCMYVCTYVYTCLSIHPSVYLSICPSIYLSSISLSLYLTISLTYQSERSTVEFRHRNSAVDMPPSLEKGQGCPGPLRSAPAPIHGKKLWPLWWMALSASVTLTWAGRYFSSWV